MHKTFEIPRDQITSFPGADPRPRSPRSAGRGGGLLAALALLALSDVPGFGAEADAQKMDPEKAKGVPVVLRVKLTKAATAIDKYGYDEVTVLAVYKNEPKARFAEPLTIAFRNTGPGVPKGESTVYLVDYHTPPEGKMWRLAGWSHAEKK